MDEADEQDEEDSSDEETDSDEYEDLDLTEITEELQTLKAKVKKYKAKVEGMQTKLLQTMLDAKTYKVQTDTRF